MKSIIPVVISLLAAAVSAPLARAGQVSTNNYSNDFTSSASDFTLSTAPSGGTGWALNTGGSGYLGHDDPASAAGVYTASIQHTLLGGAAATASGFTFTSTVTYTATGVGSGSELGVAFLNGSAALDSSGTGNGYRAYIRGTNSGGTVFLVRNGATVDSKGDASNELRDFFGDTITFTVTGVYLDNAGSDGVNDALSLSVTVFNQTKNATFSLSYLDTAPLEGNFFGIRDSDTVNSAGFNAQWDGVSLSVAAVPEPSSFAALVGLVSVGFVALRRRR